MIRPRPRHRPRHRRGSVYVLVLAAALIIVAAGLGGLSAARLRHRTTTLEQSWHESGLLAQSAVDHALVSIEADQWWRQTYADREASFGPEIPIGNGAMSWRLDDLNDSNLADNDSHPVRIHGRGRIGDAARAYSVVAWPTGTPLDVLRTAIHAGGSLDVNGVLDARGGPVSTNTGLVLGSGLVIGAAEAPLVDQPSNITGGATIPSPLKTMPSAELWSSYLSISTQINLGDVGSTTIESALLSPDHHPYRPDDRNASGVYRIKVPAYTQVKLKNSRIVGTLLVELSGDGSKFFIESGVLLSPARADFPALIVYTKQDLSNEVVITCDGLLDEAQEGVNFNPESVPYYGDFDSDKADSYGASIRGLVHVIRDRSSPPTSRTTILAPRQIFGGVIADGRVDTEATSIIVSDPRLLSQPPLGYTRERPTSSLLVNGDAENGLAGWTPVGSLVVLGHHDDQHAGASSIEVKERQSPVDGIAQSVTTGLVSGVTYTNDMWLKMQDDPDTARITLTVESSNEGTQHFSTTVPSVDKDWTRVIAPLTPTWSGTLISAVWSVTTTTTAKNFRIDDAFVMPQDQTTEPRLLPVPGTWRAEAAE